MLTSYQVSGFRPHVAGVTPATEHHLEALLYFLPRVAGVTLVQIDEYLQSAYFLPRVAGVTPLWEQMITQIMALSSPRCGGYSGTI